MNKRTILIICLIIYLIIVIGTENLYREKLYKISVEYIETIKQNGFFHYFYFFWSMIFLYGIMALGIIMTLICYPINISFTHLSFLLILIFIMCLLKSSYSQARPYWDIYLKYGNDSTVANPTECDGEFGNPSGHALLSTYLLCLWDLLLCSNFFNKIEGKKRIFIKFLTLFLTIICIIFICYSRVNRQIHSFNQVIYGAILGVAVYFTFCHILDINRISTDTFITYLDKTKFIFIPLSIILFIISVTLGLTIHNDKEKEYEIILLQYCHYIPEQIFGKNTALHSSLIFIIIGGYLGILFLKYKIKKYYPNNSQFFYEWNKGGKCTTLKIILFSFVLPAILPVVIYLFVPYHYFVIKLILLSLVFLIFGFLLYGICLYYGCVMFKKKEMIIGDNPLSINIAN